MYRTTLIAAALLITPTAFGQQGEEPETITPKVQQIDFTDDVEVNAQLMRPMHEVVLETRGAAFNPLIVLRQNFHPEMRASVDEVK